MMMTDSARQDETAQGHKPFHQIQNDDDGDDGRDDEEEDSEERRYGRR